MSEIPEHCRDGAPKLSPEQVAAMRAEIDESWSVSEALERRVKVEDFRAALRLVQAIGERAEEENHHPDLAITGYRTVTVRLVTHDADGLTANDFVLARGVDALIDSAASEMR